MLKNHKLVSAAQLEHRQAVQVRRQRWEQFRTIVMLVIIIGLIVLVVAIQLSHHV